MEKPTTRAPYRNWEHNQRLIIKALQKHYEETGDDLPSYAVLAEKTGLAERTIRRHYKNLDFGYIIGRERVHTPSVVTAIRKSAEAGKSNAQKLYAQIIENIVFKTSEEKNIIGELDVKANHSGVLKIEVHKKIITSRQDLENLQSAASQKTATVEGVQPKPKDEEILIDTVEVPVLGSATALLLGDVIDDGDNNE